MAEAVARDRTPVRSTPTGAESGRRIVLGVEEKCGENNGTAKGSKARNL